MIIEEVQGKCLREVRKEEERELKLVCFVASDGDEGEKKTLR